MSTINANSSGLNETADSVSTLQIQTNGTTAITVGTDQNVVFNSTGAITVPSGATRPSVPVNGMMRYNTSTSHLEAYVGGAWQTII